MKNNININKDIKIAMCCPSDTTLFGTNADIQIFENGETYRNFIQNMHDDKVAIVAEGIQDVNSINLIAALKKDDPLCRIIFYSDIPNKLIIDKAKKAGAEMIIDSEEYKKIVESRTKKTRGLVFSFLSGSGGTGKSTVTIMGALIAESMGLKVGIVDCDLQFGDIRYFGGTHFENCSMSLKDFDKMTLQTRIKENTKFLIYPPSRPEMAEVVSTHIKDAISVCRDNCDVVFVNSGAYWSDSHAMLMEESDLVHMLMDQRPSSVRSVKAALELCSRLSIPSSKTVPVLNRCSSKGKLSTMDCTLALGGLEVLALMNGGFEIEEALSLGIPESLIGTKNKLVKSLEELLISELSCFGITAPSSENTRPVTFWFKKSKKGHCDVAV